MDDRTIKNTSVKMSGDEAGTIEKVSAGQRVVFQAKGAVVKEALKDNQDGTFDHVATIKIDYIQVQTDEIGVAPKILTDTGVVRSKSKSKIYRDKLWHLYQKKYPGGADFEAYYDHWMEKLIEKVDQALDEERE